MPIPLGILAAAGFRPSAAGSFDLLETTVLTGSQAAVEFTNLTSKYASTYQHLQLRATLRNTQSANGNAVEYRINGDTGANYSWHWLLGNGSQVESGAGSNQNYIFEYSTVASDEAANAYSAIIVDILDPFETSKNTTTRTFAGRSTSRNHVSLSSGSWRNTASVTSYLLKPSNGNWATGSRFSLYGLKAA